MPDDGAQGYGLWYSHNIFERIQEIQGLRYIGTTGT